MQHAQRDFIPALPPRRSDLKETQPISPDALKAHLNQRLAEESETRKQLFAKISDANQQVAKFKEWAHRENKYGRNEIIDGENDALLQKSNLYQDVIDSLGRTDDAYRDAGILVKNEDGTKTPRAKLAEDIAHYTKQMESCENQVRHNEIMLKLLPKHESQPDPFMVIGEDEIAGAESDLQTTQKIPVRALRFRVDHDTITDPNFSPLARRADELEELPADAIKPLPPREEDLEELPESAIIKEEETPTAAPNKKKGIKWMRTLSGARSAHVLTSEKPYQTDQKFVHEEVPEMFKTVPTAQETLTEVSKKANIEIKPAPWKEAEKTIALLGIDEVSAHANQLRTELVTFGNRIQFNEDGTAKFARPHEKFTSLFSKQDNALRSLIGEYNKTMTQWHTLARSHEKSVAGRKAAERIKERADDTSTYGRVDLLPVDTNDIEGQKFYYDRGVEAMRAQLEPFTKSDGKFPAIVEFTKDGSARLRALSNRALDRWSAAHPDVTALVQEYNKQRAAEIKRADDIVRGYGSTVAELSPAEQEARENLRSEQQQNLSRAETIKFDALEQQGAEALGKAIVFDDVVAHIKDGSMNDPQQIINFVQHYMPKFNPDVPLKQQEEGEQAVQNTAQRLLKKLSPRQKSFAQSLTKFKSPFSSTRVFDRTNALKTIKELAAQAHNESRLILQKIPVGRAEKLTRSIRSNYARRLPLKTVISFGG